jgi:hypothetical protein
MCRLVQFPTPFTNIMQQSVSYVSLVTKSPSEVVYPFLASCGLSSPQISILSLSFFEFPFTHSSLSKSCHLCIIRNIQKAITFRSGLSACFSIYSVPGALSVPRLCPDTVRRVPHSQNQNSICFRTEFHHSPLRNVPKTFIIILLTTISPNDTIPNFQKTGTVPFPSFHVNYIRQPL